MYVYVFFFSSTLCGVGDVVMFSIWMAPEGRGELGWPTWRPAAQPPPAPHGAPRPLQGRSHTHMFTSGSQSLCFTCYFNIRDIITNISLYLYIYRYINISIYTWNKRTQTIVLEQIRIKVCWRTKLFFYSNRLLPAKNTTSFQPILTYY